VLAWVRRIANRIVVHAQIDQGDYRPKIYAVDGEVRSREIDVGMKDILLNNMMKIDTHFLCYNMLPIQRVTQYISELGFCLICK
jgi:hypothetical protein